MAIERIWQSGFESGSLDEFDGIFSNGNIETSTVKTGSYAFRGRGNNAYGYKTIPSGLQFRGGMFFYGNLLHSNNAFLRLVNAGTDLFSILGNSSGDITITTGGVVRDTAIGFHKASWQHFGWDVKFAATGGWANLYVDGVLVANYSGNTGTTNATQLRIGNITGADYSTYFDDIYIDNTTGESSAAPVPILRFYHVTPTGAGNYTQFDPSAGSNYQCVDEIPPNESDYVSTAVTDEYDSYAMDTITIDTGQTIQAVIPIAYAKRGETTEQIALGTRYSSTDSVGADQNPSTSYSMLFERQTTKPGGGAWDQTSLDGFEVLIKSRGSY
jgi:hypothetical protein